MDRRGKRILILFSLCVAIGFAGYFALVLKFNPPPSETVKIGVTFSSKYAEELGLDWREAYLAILDDLGARHLRIPIYWDRVEAAPGDFDWSEIDWMLDEAHDRGAEVLLVVGRKVPRWPECHEPTWLKGAEDPEREGRLLAFLEAEVRRYAVHPAVVRWQVENEPLFRFGECPPPDRDLLRREVDLVRSIDARPIVLTDSGELSTWLGTAPMADILGISMYRLVWNRHLGFLFWPLTPRYYSERIGFVSPLVQEVIISELQAEPWFGRPFEETPIAEQYETMDISRFRENVDFARRTGAAEVYLWGGEWWLWLETQGDIRFKTEAQKLFRTSP